MTRTVDDDESYLDAKRRRISVSSAPADSFFQAPKDYLNESEEHGLLREVAYIDSWERLQATARTILDRSNASCNKELISFITKQEVNPLKLIKTATVVTGNQPCQFYTTMIRQECYAQGGLTFVPKILPMKTGRKMVHGIFAEFAACSHRRQWQTEWIKKELGRLERSVVNYKKLRNESKGKNVLTETELEIISSKLLAAGGKYGKKSLSSLSRAFEKEFLFNPTEDELVDICNEYEHKMDAVAMSLSAESTEWISRIVHWQNIHSECVELQGVWKRLVLKFRIAVAQAEIAKGLENEKHERCQQRISEWKSELSVLINKQVEKARQKKLIPIIVEDYERLQTEVFAEFAELLSSLSSRVSFVLILAVTSSASPVYRCMPDAACRFLDIETFQLADARRCVREILRSLVVTQTLPFVISSSVLEWLYSVYFCRLNFSIKGVLQVLKFILFEHFNNKAYSFACLEKLDYNLLKMKNLDCSTNVLDILLTEDIQALGRIHGVPNLQKESLIEFKERHCAVIAVWECIESFHGLESAIFESSSGVELLGSTVGGNLGKSHTFELLISRRISAGTRRDLLHLVKNWKVVFSNRIGISLHYDDICATLKSKFEVLHETLQDFCMLFEGATDDDMSRMIVPIREEIKQVLLNIVALIKPIEEYPLSKVFLYDDLALLEKTYDPNYRLALFKQMQCPSDAVANDLPKKRVNQLKKGGDLDIGIAFEIYESSSSKINVMQWYEEFSKKLETLESKRKFSGGTKITSVERARLYKTRFVKCISILDSLGFIACLSRSSRAHVARMIFL